MYASSSSSFRFPANLFADLDELQRQLEHVFGSRSWPSSIRSVGRGNFPAINMGTTPDAVEIYAFIPGVNPRELEVSVDKGLLTIAGERKSSLPKESNNKLSVYARERTAGSFRRVVSLPDDVDPSRVNADYRNGVLHVSIQKREASKPRRIEVRDVR